MGNIIYLIKGYYSNDRVRKIFYVVVFALIGMILLRFSSALTQIAGIDPEDGSLSGNVGITSDPEASNGQAIVFGQKALYVSSSGKDSNPGTVNEPFATIAHARDVVRTMNSAMTGNITVYVRSGTYDITNTLTFDIADSGMNGHDIIYRSYPGETATISGGQKITGWTVADSGKNIWKASVPSGSNFLQLYVNGARAQVARGSDRPAGYTKTGSGFTTPDSSMQNWRNVEDVRVVGFNQWKLFKCPISSITSSIINIVQPCWDNALATNDNWVFNSVQYIENAYELLDSEGEWYLDRSTNTVYYKPKIGENLTTSSVVAPMTETLIKGTNVHNLAFENFRFAYAGWTQPSDSSGYTALQGGYHFVGTTRELQRIAGNLTFRGSSDIRFEGNVFARLGGSGLVFDGGSQDTEVIGNKFEDISGPAVMYGDINDSAQSDVAKQNRLSSFKDNYVTKVGQDYYDAAAVFAGYIDGLSIDHNEIYDVPHSPVAIGWGWGIASYAKNNAVTNNYFHDFTKVLQDSSAVYLLGPMQNTVISKNYWSNGVNKYGCIYPDQGTAYTTWSNNVCKQVHEWLHIWQSSVHDNIVQNNYYDSPGNTNNGTNNSVSGNTYVSNNVWPTAAQTIMDTAGIEQKYLGIKNASLP